MSEERHIAGKEAGAESRYSPVPEAYFEKLAGNVMLRIETRPKTVTVKRRLSLKIWLPLAAAILIAGIFVFRPDPVSPGLQVQAELATLSDEEIIEALLNDPVAEEELAASLPETLPDSLIDLQADLIEEELSTERDIEILIEEL